MTFDPTNHRFGMAYKHPRLENETFYPKQLDNDNCLQGFYLNEPSIMNHVWWPELERAPEHDLIPMQDALKLVRYLERIGIPTLGGKLQQQLAQEALATWNEKYGEKR